MVTRPKTIEERLRPFALYGLISFFLGWSLSALLMFSDAVADGFEEHNQVLIPFTQIWIVTAVLSMFAALIGAIFVISRDGRMDATLRRKWMLILVFTNLFGGCLFLTWRWWKRGQDNSAPESAISDESAA